MKKMFLAFAICMVGVLAVSFTSASAREATVKIGGGVFFDESLFGGNAQVDIPVAMDGKINVSPFVDAYVSKSWFKVVGGGLNLVYKVPAGETGKFFVGAGGGFGQVRLSGLDGTGAMANVQIGGEFEVSEKISIFGQGRWLGFWGGTDDLEPRNFAIEAGIAFNLGN